MTRAINESDAGLGNRRQPNCHRVTVSNRWALKPRSGFDSVSLAKQLANGDLRFAWITLPFSDRVRNEIIKPE